MINEINDLTSINLNTASKNETKTKGLPELMNLIAGMYRRTIYGMHKTAEDK
jgi:hypothetical protein